MIDDRKVMVLCSNGHRYVITKDEQKFINQCKLCGNTNIEFIDYIIRKGQEDNASN